MFDARRAFYALVVACGFTTLIEACHHQQLNQLGEFPVLEVTGCSNTFQIGHAVGEAFADIIKARLAESKSLAECKVRYRVLGPIRQLFHATLTARANNLLIGHAWHLHIMQQALNSPLLSVCVTELARAQYFCIGA